MFTLATLITFLQGNAQAKPDYKAVREAISDILEAENYDDGTFQCTLPTTLPLVKIVGGRNAP